MREISEGAVANDAAASDGHEREHTAAREWRNREGTVIEMNKCFSLDSSMICVSPIDKVMRIKIVNQCETRSTDMPDGGEGG